jgi:Flp pilus assembly protein TadG
MRRWSWIGRQLQFVRDTRAVAAVEFALILPLLLLLYLGTVEGASLYAADRKVATLASTMADLVSREKDGLRESELNDYFAASDSILLPYTSDGLGQIISLLAIDEDGVATVEWSVGRGTSQKREDGSEFPLGADRQINQLARNGSGYLVVAEVTYPYVPITGFVFQDTINLGRVEYFLPRVPARIGYTPSP